MKQPIKIGSALLLVLVLLFSAISCKEETAADTDGLWSNATYDTDTTLGEGANTVSVEVTAGDKSVTFTVKTDKATLGEALFEHGLINDAAFFDTCNGIKADWDEDQAYWAFYIGDERAAYGVNDSKASTTSGAAYRLIYTK